jgi:cytochrome P450
MMRNDANFRDALSFDGFRGLYGTTVNPPSDLHASKPSPTGLADSSDAWLVWGAGRLLCPGRFYTTMILKLVVAHLVTDYDIILPESTSSRSVQWRSAIIPKSTVSLLVSERKRV